MTLLATGSNRYDFTGGLIFYLFCSQDFYPHFFVI